MGTLLFRGAVNTGLLQRCCWKVARQPDAKTGSAGLSRKRAGDADLTLMLLDDGIAHGQSQAGAFSGVLGGKKGLEQLGLMFGGNAAALVGNAQFYPVRAGTGF